MSDEPMGDVEPVVAALERMTGGDEALMHLAMLYATAYRNDPEAVMGMFMASQGIILQRVSETHTFLMGLQEKIAPYLENPELLGDLLPPGVKDALDMLSKFGG